MWTSVSRLSILIETGQQQCDIYGNSRNMIGVVISLQPTDENGNPVRVDQKTLMENTWLADYVDEARLNWRGQSEWCYTDTPNQFHTIPGVALPTDADANADLTAEGGLGAEGEAEVQVEDGFEEGETPQIKFYVYCSDVTRLRTKAIGIGVRPASGNLIYSSHNGTFHSSVQVTALESVLYKRADINWDHQRATTHPGDASVVYNYYLSCAKNGFSFITFSVVGYCSMVGQDGIIGWQLANSYRDFYGAYVWYQEPHVTGQRTIINFPGDWQNQVTVYDKEYPNRLLCCTWAFNRHGGNGWWHLPNGPMWAWWQYYNTQVYAYDQYGNYGHFWIDARNINPNYGPAAAGASETVHGLFAVDGDPAVFAADPADPDPWPSGPKLDIYDYNPHP